MKNTVAKHRCRRVLLGDPPFECNITDPQSSTLHPTHRNLKRQTNTPSCGRQFLLHSDIVIVMAAFGHKVAMNQAVVDNKRTPHSPKGNKNYHNINRQTRTISLVVVINIFTGTIAITNAVILLLIVYRSSGKPDDDDDDDNDDDCDQGHNDSNPEKLLIATIIRIIIHSFITD